MSRLVPRTLSFTIRAFAIESGLVTLEAETGSNDNADSITEALKLSRVFEGVRKTESGPLPENPARVLFKIQFKTKG
ncbi:MAG: hypothetical protein HY814_01285 [Candidatus Riflebacteria bacterium]|nr:hypothetical protein [Candidatus Riflebacteria bacterium]